MAIKLFHPYVSWRAVWYVMKVLLHGKQLAEGPLVKQFEFEFAKKFKKSHVVALNSGTSALELAYELAGIGAGDEVITSVLTCTATNLPLIHRNAKIVFADIDYDLNLSIKDVEKKITKKTKAIVFVHFGGNNRGLADLFRICAARGIILIEDAAQAIGSDYWGKADYTCVSLQAIKTLTTGDGGVLLVKDTEKYHKARRLRWFGYDRELKQRIGDHDLTEAGYKYHMNDVAAAIGLGNLKSIDKVIEKRKKIAAIYALYGIKCHSWLAVGAGFLTRGPMLTDAGIPVGQHHFRNDKYTIFGKQKKLKVMDAVENDYFFLPFHHKITKRQAHKIGKLYAQ